MSARSFSEIFADPSLDEDSSENNKAKTNKNANSNHSTRPHRTAIEKLNELEGQCYHTGCPAVTTSGRQYCEIHSKEEPNITFIEEDDNEHTDTVDETLHTRNTKNTSNKNSKKDYSSESSSNDIFSANFFDPPPNNSSNSDNNNSNNQTSSTTAPTPKIRATRQNKTNSSPLIDLFAPLSSDDSNIGTSSSNNSNETDSKQAEEDAAMAQFQAMLYSNRKSNATLKSAPLDEVVIPHVNYAKWKIHNSTPEKIGVTNYIGIIPWEIPVEFEDAQPIGDYSFLYDYGSDDDMKLTTSQISHIRTASQVNLTTLLHSSHELAVLASQQSSSSNSSSNNNTSSSSSSSNNTTGTTPRTLTPETVSGHPSPRIPPGEVDLSSPLGPVVSNVTQRQKEKKAKLLNELKLNEKDRKFMAAAAQASKELHSLRAQTPVDQKHNSPNQNPNTLSERTTPTIQNDSSYDLLYNPDTEDFGSCHTDDLYERIKELESRNNQIERDKDGALYETERKSNHLSMQRMMAEIMFRINEMEERNKLLHAETERIKQQQQQHQQHLQQQQQHHHSQHHTQSTPPNSLLVKASDHNSTVTPLSLSNISANNPSPSITKRSRVQATKKYKTLDLSNLVSLSSEEFHAQAKAFLANEKQQQQEYHRQQLEANANNNNTGPHQGDSTHSSGKTSPAQSNTSLFHTSKDSHNVNSPPQLNAMLQGPLIRATAVPPLAPSPNQQRVLSNNNNNTNNTNNTNSTPNSGSKSGSLKRNSVSNEKNSPLGRVAINNAPNNSTPNSDSRPQTPNSTNNRKVNNGSAITLAPIQPRGSQSNNNNNNNNNTNTVEASPKATNLLNPITGTPAHPVTLPPLQTRSKSPAS